jgi:hypothetical protein
MKMTKRELTRRFAEANAKLHEAQHELESVHLDTVEFLVQTRQTHLLKVNWSRLLREAQHEM